ncbi:hypothetical protein MFIFM68171_04974 [Madurella fahalii]|uniref:Uncharacterized protein n=1 Tax=Madurella fahalii TaxID=1157608 RepID=A0ABQ0GAL2_9PEZI
MANANQAALIITDSVKRFKETVRAEHQRQIENTAVQDVIDTIISIQADLQRRRATRNLRTLYPFIQGLEKYSKAIDALSNGLSSYMPWIWAPIKPMLQVTSDYLGAFDKLIEAYDRIAETPPRVQKLGGAFKDSPALLSKLSHYYSDIIEFHRRAYKFVARRSWKFFFMTSWAYFDVRFDSILTSMARHRDSIDQEAVTIDILEAKKWREDVASEVLRECLPKSCDWIQGHAKMIPWLQTGSKSPVIWIHGKPGAGKTVLCASLVEHLQETGMATICYFCRYSQADTSSKVLKAPILQLINQNPDLAAVAYADYVEKHREPSLKVLRGMLEGTADKPGLLTGASPCRIVIDGVHECEPREQKFIIEDLLYLVSVDTAANNCKLLICSRSRPDLTRALHKKVKATSTISLSDESDSITHGIEGLARARLSDIAVAKRSWQLSDALVTELCQVIAARANGTWSVYSYVRLVLDTLSDVDRLRELHDSITAMPSELSDLYGKILAALCQRKTDKVAGRVVRILAWLVYTKRPLKKFEVVHGVALTPESPVLDEWEMLDDSAVDKCEPLVEELRDGSIGLIHFTAEEYLRTRWKSDQTGLQSFNSSIAFSCSLALRDGLSLLDPNLSEEDRLARVVNGSHNLLPYAIDFWLDHLLDGEAGERMSPHDSHGTVLTELEQRHQELWSKIKHGSKGLIWKRAEFETAAVEQDPTLLTWLSITFRSLVKQLLARTEIRDVPAEQVARFKERYSQCFYRCRFSPCTSASIGFATESLKIDHEKLHVRGIYCARPNCWRASIAFRHQKDLADHNRRYHAEGCILVPPRVRVVEPDHGQPEPNLNLGPVPDSGSSARPRSYAVVPSPTCKKTTLSFGNAMSQALQNAARRGLSDSCDSIVIFTQDTKARIEVGHIRTIRLDNRPSGACFSPYGTLIAIGYYGLVEMVDADFRKLLYRYGFRDTRAGRASELSFSPSAKLLAIAAGDELLRVWNYAATTALSVRTSKGHEGRISGVSYAPNGQFIATASYDGSVRLWREGDQETMIAYLAIIRGRCLTSITISPNSRFIATSSNDGNVSIWDAESGSLFQRIYRRNSNASIRMSNNGRFLATTCSNTGVRLHQIKRGEIGIPAREGFASNYHEGSATDVAFTSDLQWLISCSSDGTTMFWDTETDVPHAIMMCHRDSITRVAAAGSRPYVVTVSIDGTIRIWRYTTLRHVAHDIE